MLNNNFLALLVTLAVALVWLRINDALAHRGIISSQLSRKIIHTGTGPFFVLCWLLFNESPASRWLAALVPLGITVQFLLVGLGVIKDQAAVDAMSRSGNRREILRGPLFYGIAFVVLTVFYWYDSPIGITALMLLCGGDGLADIIGKRFGRLPLPWAKEKTLAGSIAMFAGGLVFSIIILTAFSLADKMSVSISQLWLPVSVIVLAGTLVESIPIKDIDNISITISAVILGHFLYI